MSIGKMQSVDASALGDKRRPIAMQDRRSLAVWFVTTLCVSAIGAVIPLIVNPRFYYYDDTASGAFGIWFEIGQKLRSGEWPLFSTEAWSAGNYAAEGQWGIWNPAILLLGLAASFASNVVIFTTAVKIVTLVTLAAGTFLLTRGYGASHALSASAGLGVTVSGFTVYMDAPSWVTGLFVFALLPWVLWAARAMMLHQLNPIVPFFFGYLLITIGYVHGTIMLVLALAGLLLEAFLTRRTPPPAKLALLGVLLGLIALATYLPGVLTASVSAREDEILNTGWLSTDLTGFATSSIASSTPQINGWWGTYAPVPLLFSTWLLPALFLVDFRRAFRAIRGGAGILTLLIAAAALTLAPSDLGPLRFPVRLAPYVALALIVIVHVLLSRFRISRPSAARVRGALFALVVVLYLAFSQVPDDSGLHLTFVIISAIGVVLIARMSANEMSEPRGRANSQVVLGAVLIVITLATALFQRQTFPSSPLPDYNLPNDVAAYETPLDGIEGGTFVVGQPNALPPTIWEETLVANTWYLSDTDSHNLYSPVQFQNYAWDLCMDTHGWTCEGALGTLFTPDPEIGALPVDLLSINAIQILRQVDDPSGVRLRAAVVPDGWRQTFSTANSRVWERAGEPTKTGEVVFSEDADVVVLDQTDRRLVMRVDSVGEDGGRVVLSRLAWPGYTVSEGATIGEPLRDYLLSVEVSPTAADQVIVVEFQPPGWVLVVSSIVISIIGAVVWSLLHERGRRRRAEALDATVRVDEQGPLTV
jgi:hypothetical protein